MAILKPGFTLGFRGRMQPPALNRRAFYLLAEADRDSARLLGCEGQELTALQGIEVMGGPSSTYHEVIVSPSEAECGTIRARFPEDPQRAASESGLRVAKAYAKGRSFLLAIHEQDGRFHFHIVVAGAQSERALGKQGELQKIWDREIYGDEPRIQDWNAHQRFKEEKLCLQQIIRDQRENELQRREAVKRAAPGQKAAAARPFERKSRDLIERRYASELTAIQARYEARGTLGSPRHQAELEQATFRRTGALRRLESREMSRDLGAAKERMVRAVDVGGRIAQRGTRAASTIGRVAVNLAMKELGVPAPARTAVRVGMAMGEEALQAALRASQEAAKAAARSSVHVAQASIKLGAGLIAAIPTAGASLEAAGKEASKDLAKAGKELGQGAVKGGLEIGKGAVRGAAAGAHELMPRELRLAIGAATTATKTTLGAAKDIATLSPLSLGKTLAGGAVDLAKTGASAAGLQASLPEPLRRAFQVSGWVPVVGIAAKAAEVAAETAHTALSAARRGMEVDR